MDSFDNSEWDLLDYPSTNFCWSNHSPTVEIDASFTGAISQENLCAQKSPTVEIDASFTGAISQENLCARKRGREKPCRGPGSKACREKLRRDKMNDRFTELCSVLEPGRPAKSDKSAILSDAIRVLNQLRTETQELKESNDKLQEDIKSLKAEKNELREEKLQLKADKERMEQQMKAMTIPPVGFVPPMPPMPSHPAAYPGGGNKLMAYPGYGGFPMWQWIPQTALDTSQDHVLRPPVA